MYTTLFNMPGDLQQVKTMSQRMYPDKPNYMIQKYKEAISKPYGYLVIDLKPATPEQDRLRTNIMDDKDESSPVQATNTVNSYFKSPPSISNGPATDSDGDMTPPVDLSTWSLNDTLMYMKWMQSVYDKVDLDPPHWTTFLRNISYRSDIDRALIQNNKALAHLCVYEWNSSIRPRADIPCDEGGHARVCNQILPCVGESGAQPQR